MSYSAFLFSLLIGSLLCLSAPLSNETSIEQGKRDKNGKLVIHNFRTREGPVPVPLCTDFGFMVLNVGTENHPVAEFKLASDKDSRVSVFSSLNDFTNALATLPRGTILPFYNKCLVPTTWGLDTNLLPVIERFCLTRGITVTNGPFATCTCPNKI